MIVTTNEVPNKTTADQTVFIVSVHVQCLKLLELNKHSNKYELQHFSETSANLHSFLPRTSQLRELRQYPRTTHN